MEKRSSGSSPQDSQKSGNEPHIVRSTRKAGDPLSEEMLAEIEALKGLSDDDINFSDIPPTPPEFWQQAQARRALRAQNEIKKLRSA